MHRSKIKPKNYKKLIYFLASLFSLFFLVFIFLKFAPLNIKEVEVKTNGVECTSPEVIKNVVDLSGKNILFLSDVSLEQKLKDKFICISKIKLHRGLSGKVILEVTGRIPVAILIESRVEENISTRSAEASFSAIESSPSGQFNFVGEGDQYLIDNEGVIFSKKGGGVPKIYFEGINLIVGKKLEDGIIMNALKILDRIRVFGVQANEAKIYLQNIFLVNSVPKMVFSLNSNIDLQLAALQLLLEQAKINEENMEFIDLRFEKPIVKYVPKKK